MIEEFVKKLSEKIDLENVENQYSFQFEHNNITRHNLIKYLEVMKSLKPDTILVGEAPGYKGCKLTGIPFTSEKIISTEFKKSKIFGFENSFKIINPDEKPQSEITATIVWNYLKSIDKYPLTWNAFPFHPYKKGQIDSNRKPNAKDLEYGKEILLEIIDMFNIKKIVAVGGVPYKTLTKLGIDCQTVRHPANGGKNDFISGMNKIL